MTDSQMINHKKEFGNWLVTNTRIDVELIIAVPETCQAVTSEDLKFEESNGSRRYF